MRCKDSLRQCSQLQPLTQRQEAAWRQFQENDCTVANRNHDCVHWHRGRKQFALWAIVIEAESWWAAVNAARNQLVDFLLAENGRQPHVTLFVCGFPATMETRDDDFSLKRFEQQIANLFRAAPSSFTLHLGRLSSFSSSVYFEIDDAAGDLDRIRMLLAAAGPEIRSVPYLPHLTVGLYSDRYPVALVAKKIRSFTSAIPLSFVVRDIALLTYEPGCIAGPLQTHYSFKLR